ncbi:MAG: hypothetical protein AB3N13_13085 [Arenibacterium sp.]
MYQQQNQPGFIFGGDTNVSYDQLQNRRRIVERLSAQNSRTPRNAGEGIHAIARALAVRGVNRQIAEGEAAGRAQADEQWSSLFGGAPLDGSTAIPTASSVAPISGDWLTYSNQNATRNDPLSPELVSALDFLPEMGVTMEVFSGGQENNTTHGLGSTRHNHGNAADVFFAKDGRRLSWENASDIPVLQEIVRKGKAKGLTGFGAGPGYMQPGSMHIGFGDPAVWGAGGKGANAPAWLREAYDGSPSAIPQGGLTSAPNLAAIADALGNPFMPEGRKAVLGEVLQQQIAANRPMTPLQSQQHRLNELKIEQLENAEPKRPIIKGADGFSYYQDTGERVLPNVVAASETSPKEAQIARLEETLPREVAVGIADGRLVVGRDPVTGEAQIIDKATGTPVQMPPQGDTPAPQTAPTPSAPGQTKPPLSFGDRFQGGDTSFGIGGLGRGLANTAADMVGADVPFPETQQAQADFGILRESLLNSVAQGYGRQPPSWVLKAIDQNLPKTGSALIGPQKAQSQLRALASEFESQKAQLQARLGQRMRPNVRGDVEAQISGIESALEQINAALDGIAPKGAETGEARTTKTGIGWSVRPE